MSFIDTVIIYIFIFFTTTVLASSSQVILKNGDILYRPSRLFFSFMIHWFFLVFTDIGVDYQNYTRIIDRVTLYNFLSDSEVGFSALCLLLKSLFHSPDIVIFFLKTITLILFYFGFNKVKGKVELGVTVLCYNAFLYLQGLYIFGMQINIALLFLSVIYILNQENIKSIVFLILASSMHSTGLFFIPIYILFFWFNRRNKQMSKVKIGFIVLIYLAGYVSLGMIYDYAIHNIPQLQQYKAYGEIMNYSGTGIMQFVFFVPVLYFVHLINKNCTDGRYKNFTTIVALTAFLFAMIGYRFQVFARINKNFFMLYGLLIPMLLFMRKSPKNNLKEHSSFYLTYMSDMFIWIFYLLFRGFDVFIDCMNVNSTSGLREYDFFWPF